MVMKECFHIIEEEWKTFFIIVLGFGVELTCYPLFVVCAGHVNLKHWRLTCDVCFFMQKIGTGTCMNIFRLVVDWQYCVIVMNNWLQQTVFMKLRIKTCNCNWTSYFIHYFNDKSSFSQSFNVMTKSFPTNQLDNIFFTPQVLVHKF